MAADETRAGNAEHSPEHDLTRFDFYVESVWPGFICNLVVVKQDLIEKNPHIIEKLVRLAARSGIWAQHNAREAATIASRYWNQPSELVEYALTVPEKRIVYDRFQPRHTELQHMADLMVQVGLLESNQIAGLVDDAFARKVDMGFEHSLRPLVRENIKGGILYV